MNNFYAIVLMILALIVALMLIWAIGKLFRCILGRLFAWLDRSDL